MVPQIFLAPSTGTFGLEGPFDLLEDVWELSAWALHACLCLILRRDPATSTRFQCSWIAPWLCFNSGLQLLHVLL